MKMIITTAAFAGACALGATGALAQTSAAAPAPQTTAPATAAPATPATPATSASFTDGDVDQFATAVIAVQNVQKDTSIADADKQTKMAAAVQQAGLTPDKFNSMAQTSQSDPALMKRIQTAATAKMPAAPTAPSPAQRGQSGARGSGAGTTGSGK